MKNLFLCGALAASLCAINSLAPVQAQETTAPAPTNVFTGRLRPANGAKYNMRVFIRSKMSQDIPVSRMGDKPVLKKSQNVSIIKFNADYDIVSMDAYGNHQVRVTYHDFSVDMDMSVDGKTQPAKLKADVKRSMDEYLKVMDGVSFLVKLSPTNQVFSVYGLDAIRAKVVKQLERISPQARAGAESMLSGFLSDKNAAKNFGNLSGQLPSQPIRVSESWNYSTTAPENMPTIPSIEGTRTLVSLTNGVATIKDTAEFTLNGPVANSEMPGKTTTTMNIVGTQNAITHVNNATGMPLDSTATQTMNGTITIGYGPKDETIELALSSVNEFRFVMEQE